MMERVELPKQEKKNKSAHRKVNFPVLGNIGSGYYQRSGYLKKKNKNLSQTNENSSWNQALEQESHHRDKHLACHPRKVHGTIHEMDEGRISINGQEN